MSLCELWALMHDTNHMARHIEWKQSSSLNVYRRRVALWNWTRNAHFENMRGNAGRAPAPAYSDKSKSNNLQRRSFTLTLPLPISRLRHKSQIWLVFLFVPAMKKADFAFPPTHPHPFIHFGSLRFLRIIYSGRASNGEIIPRACVILICAS